MARGKISDDPSDYDAAVAEIRRRVPLTEDELERLGEAYREHAFTVANVTSADVVTDVWEALQRAVSDGTTLDDFKDEIGDKLERAWGGPDPARLETIFRTNVQTAYQRGRYELMKSPALRRVRPYARLDGVGDSRQSEICEAVDGTVLPIEELEERRMIPPLHFNCRTNLVPISADDADEGERETPEDAEPDEGFGSAPPKPGEWEPDLNGYPAGISEILAERLRR